MKFFFNDNENLKNQLNFSFLSNNVKGLQSNKKLKKKIGPKAILFLQETHSCVETERKWWKILKTKFTTHMVKLIDVGY